MIVLGSAWTSGVCDLQLEDDGEIDITEYELRADFYERIGTRGGRGDDYGSPTDDQGAALLSVTTEDGGVVISDGDEGKFYITLTKAQTGTLRDGLGRPFFKSRNITIQVRRVDDDRSDHVIFLTDRTQPGAGP